MSWEGTINLFLTVCFIYLFVYLVILYIYSILCFLLAPLISRWPVPAIIYWYQQLPVPAIIRSCKILFQFLAWSYMIFLLTSTNKNLAITTDKIIRQNWLVPIAVQTIEIWQIIIFYVQCWQQKMNYLK